MSELREVAEQTKPQEVQPVWRHKVIAIIIMVFVLYIAYCCVFQNFKLLTFMNIVVENVLSFLNAIILFFSNLIRTIFSWF